ncbi:malonyl-CoA decarboxylase [Enterovirga rhinocerotis]|uniref:Malonyl-CoA decarboxylase n=1 Tax=Enterovirga rhinocerotis TaxID=1339210 RepID=A0A4V3DYR6_9HYPH|nr:malonyl-CoA decarboxylase [Enterovirga rhinocerotis]TDR93669.1 malonyl-CoA decarboxylase [Enterovirga rhinocerotis]
MATSFLNDLMQTLSDRGRSWIGRPREAARPGDLAELGDALLSRRGEASGVVLARALLDGYAAAPLAARLAFLTALADRFGPDRERLDRAIAAYQADPTARAMHELQEAAEPRRQELVRRLNLAPGGTAALVRMRQELLGHLKSRPDLAEVDRDFTHLLSSWFNRGFLVLRPIDWTTPANILERIIRYEAVHAIDGWEDLRRRLEPADRRCYAFFHPQLVDKPLIFVEVALTNGIPRAIAPLLDSNRLPQRAEDADTAVFYSISNTQKGLAGVSFGHFLIKQVVEELKRDLPNLKTFVTLSPVPGFARWLDSERRLDHSRYFNADAKEVLSALDTPGWHQDKAIAERVRAELLPAAAAYFLRARSPGGRPVDPVARFHLGNGARLEFLNFLGDLSEKGLSQAHGLMVNYRYDLDEIERNHELYAEKGDVVAAPGVRKLVKAEAPVRELA